MRSSGNGEAGVRGAPAGDLFVVIHVKRHEIFTRDGDDLLCEIPISFVQAALGDVIEVPTLTEAAEIKVPAATQPGTVFRLKGKGVKNVQGYGQGDLLVRVQIEVPAKLNAAQRAKLEEFAKLCDENVHPMGKSFFEKAKVACLLTGHAPLLTAAVRVQRRSPGDDRQRSASRGGRA